MNDRSSTPTPDTHGPKTIKQSESNGDPFANEGEVIRRCMTAGFFLNAATRLPDGRYRCLGSGIEVHMHPSSTMFGKKAQSILFNELMETSKKYIRMITPIEQLWLLDASPMFFADAAARM